MNSAADMAANFAFLLGLTVNAMIWLPYVLIALRPDPQTAPGELDA